MTDCKQVPPSFRKIAPFFQEGGVPLYFSVSRIDTALY